MQAFGFRGAVALLAALVYLASFAIAPVVQARIISTEAMLQQEQRSARLAHVRELLAQERVAEQMIALGVDPSEVQARVASLTDQQLMHLENRLTELPAGGSVLAVIGVVFVVLLVLELVGAINLFTSV